MLIAAVLAVVGTAKCGYGRSIPAANAQPVTLRIGLALPKTSDASSGVTSFVGNQTSEQLVGVGWDGRPIPRLVSAWKPSSDGRELTLTLTKGLHFHDGTPIDAAFVRDGLLGFLKTSPLSYVRHKSIVAIEADSVDTITIRVSRPEGLLLADLSNFLIAHPTNRAIGVGPYRLLPGKPMRLEKFDAYYRGRPQIDFVEVHEFEEQRSTWAALMRGEIDAVHDISSGAIDFVQAEGQTAVRTFPFTRPYFISLTFNTRHPLLKAPKVRQALSYAVDRPSIIKVAMNGQGSPAEGPIWPFHWAYSAAPKTYSRNVEAAALGLESAGLHMKKAAEPGHMPSRFRFRCLTVPRFEKIALTLQKQLSEVGVDLEVQTVSLQELVGRAQAGDYDSLLMEWTSGRSLVWTYSFFHSSARSLGYKSADAPLDRIRSASGDADTRAAVSDFQRVLFEDPPAIFLAWPQVARVVSSRFVVPEDTAIPGTRTTDQATTPGRDVISSLWYRIWSMKRITSRFVLLIASAAIAPLVAYGFVSLLGLNRGTRASVSAGNLGVAQQVAARIAQYIDHNTRVLRSIGLALRGTDLQQWQQARILKDYVLDFPEFREISFFAAGGRVIATSKLSGATLSIPEAGSVDRDGVFIAPLQLDEDGLPRTTIAVRVTPGGQESAWIVGEIALEELWRTVDRIRVGREGFALLVAEQRLIAHGNPNKKRRVATSGAPGAEKTPEQTFAAQLLAEPAVTQVAGLTDSYNDGEGQDVLAVAALVPRLPWVVIVEQPISEAFSLLVRLQRLLLLAIGLALLGTVILGWFWGRSFITRIFALTRATQALAEGRMDERVAIGGKDEIRQLGDAFNSMADRLVQLQEDVRRQERQAMFGKIAAGLVHDLSHPIQTIVTNSKLIVRMFDDAEYRDTFKRMIERESLVIKRVLEDLRNIAQPIPLEHFPVDIDRSVADVVESMKVPAETAGVNLRAELGSVGALVQGDVFALGRVYRNLLINAIQATAPGGDVAIATEATTERVRVKVSDTGCGIPPDRIGAIFDDFVTTKRRGLGLGLAISRKIVEQLGGQISVTSEVGKGTTFVLDFPRAQARPIALAAG